MKASKSEEGKKTVWDRFTSWVSHWLGKTLSFLGKYTGISWVLGEISSVWKSVFGGKGAGKEGAATEPEGKTQESPKDNVEHKKKVSVSNPENPEPIELTEKEVSEFVNSALALVKSNNELGKDLISQLESISQDSFKDILFNHCGSMSDIRFKYFSKGKESRILVLDKEAVGYLVKEKEFVQLLSQVKPEISIPKSVPDIKKASAAATPESQAPQNYDVGREDDVARPKGNGMGDAFQPKFEKYFSSDENSLLLVITKEHYMDLKNNYQNKDKKGEFCAFVQCVGENFCITGSYASKDLSNGKKAIPVTSVKNEKFSEAYVKTKLSEMKTKVGFDDSRFVEITKMSPKPFEPVVSIPKSAPGVETGSDGDQEKFIGSIKVEGDNLKLVVPDKHMDFIEKNINLVYVQCGNNVLRITCDDECHISYEDDEYFSINSVAMKDGASVSSKLDEMRNKLGLNKATEVKVTIMSPGQATEAKSPANGSQPNPSFINPDPKLAPGSGVKK